MKTGQFAVQKEAKAYDKSRDEEIPCLFCGRMNPVKNDNCTFCHNPMIK